VLLGDAAHVVHPLAGQGLNLGLMDAAALAEVLGPRDDLTLKLPRAALRRFERMRRSENLVMLKVTDQINRLFRDEHQLVRRVRGFTMTAVGGLVPLKHWLILRAMGDVGDVPVIAALR
jgi:2-polyprenyl-6-methoxyphenol hydroxylase-like FAD-dependent oxidoreductase